MTLPHDIDVRLTADQRVMLRGFEPLATPMWLTDVDAVAVVWANVEGRRLWRVSCNADFAARDFSTNTPTARDRVRAAWRRCKDGHRRPSQRKFFPDGQPVLVDIAGTAWTLGDDSPALLVEAHEVETTTHKSELERLVDALRYTAHGVAMFDADGTVLAHNPAFSTLFVSARTQESMGLATLRRSKLLSAASSNERVHLDAMVNGDDGVRRHLAFDAYPAVDPTTGSRASVVAVADTTQFWETTAFLDALFDNLPSMAFVKAAGEDRIVRANAAAERFFGVARGALVGLREGMLLPSLEASTLERDAVTLADGRPVRVAPTRCAFPDRAPRVLEGFRVPVLRQHDPPSSLLVLWNDATEREALREDLERTNAELDAFASAVAHDLRAPLSTVSGLAALLQAEESPDAVEVRSFLDAIIDASNRGRTLIDDLLRLARTGAAPTPHDVDLDDVLTLVRHDLSALITERSATLEVDTVLPTVHGVGTLLHTLLQNLVGNAIVHGSDRPTVRVRARSLHDAWVLEVHDDGPGIPKDRRDAIFRPFVRLEGSKAGLGIGLAIAMKAARLHGGDIHVDDAPDGGTIVSVTLPRQNPLCAAPNG